MESSAAWVEVREQAQVELADLLDYLNFRHFVRSGYAHRLKWQRMAALALGCDATFERLVAELSAFFGVDP